jgi:hypothetical protein
MSATFCGPAFPKSGPAQSPSTGSRLIEDSRRLWVLTNPAPGFPAANDSFSKDPVWGKKGRKHYGVSFCARRAEITLAFIGAAVLFLPFFRSLPKLIQYGMKADAPGKLLIVRGERADQEGVTGFVICDGLAGAGPGY